MYEHLKPPMNADVIRSFPRGGRRKYSINSSPLHGIYDVVSNDCKVYMMSSGVNTE